MTVPTFSIIISTYNRQIKLLKCLKAIAKLEYPKEKFEVLVINDGGDFQDELIKEFKTIHIRLFKIKNSGPATARNYGAQYAYGNILVFTDDDCEPCKLWLHSFEKAIGTYPNAAFGGKIINGYPLNNYSSASELIIEFLHNYLPVNLPRDNFFTSNNFCISRRNFFLMSGFDGSYTFSCEDRDFCKRWIANGYQLIYIQESRVIHYHRLNFNSFWKQHFSYGCGAYYLSQKHRKTYNIFERLKFYAAFFKFPFSNMNFMKALIIDSVLVISQAALFSGYIYERFKSKFTSKHSWK